MDFSQDLEFLARQKTFDALDAQERARVLAEMSQEEYEGLHALLGALPLLEGAAAPPPALRADVLRRFQAQPAPGNRWKTLAISAAVFSLGALAGWYLRPPVKIQVAPTVIERQVMLHDTLFIEKPCRHTLVPAAAPRRVQPIQEMAIDVPETQGQPEPPAPGWIENRSNVGAPLSDTPELLEFFTQTEEKK